MKVVRENPEGEGAGPAPADQVNPDLLRLADQAGQLHQEGEAAEQAAAGGPPPPPIVTNATLIAGLLEIVPEVAGLVWSVKSPKAILTHDRATELGNLWGAVCDKRGIDLQKLMGDWSLEVAAATATMVICNDIRKAVAAELAARKPKQGAGEAGPGDAQ